MAYSWAKVYIEILDDHKMGLLPDSLWRRVIELILLAKRFGEDGTLPGLLEMSWTLRMPAEKLEADLTELAKTGIVQLKEGAWFLTNFAKRQDAEPDIERMKNYRKREHDKRYDGVTTRNIDLRLDKTTDTDTDKDTSSGANAPDPKASARDELRFDSSPQGALMAQKLRAVYQSKGRRPPEFYANAIQRDAYLTAFRALGNRLSTLLDSAMESDISERARLLKWLQGCVKNDNGNGNSRHASSGQTGKSRGVQAVEEFERRMGISA